MLTLAPPYCARAWRHSVQGLFHPARRVREAYWKIYNNVYVGAQDGLVAAYPALEDELDDKSGEITNTYIRTELFYAL